MNNTQKFLQNKTSICAGLALIGYFLPWVTFSIFSLSGYDILRLADMEAESNTVLKLFYGFPLSLSAIIAGNFIPKLERLNKIFACIAILLMGYLLFKITGRNIEGKSIFSFMSIGFYVSVIATGALGYFVFTKKETSTENKTSEQTTSETTISLAGTTESHQVITEQQSKTQSSFDFGNWFSKNKKVVVVSISLAVLICAGYFIFVKNSYQKTMSALDNRNWQDVIYNYEKAISEINDGKLKLDYDEKKKIDVARWIADNMIPIDEFRKKFYVANRSILQTYYDLDKEWAELPNLKNKPAEAGAVGIDANKIYKPAVLFSDSFNLAFAELLVPNDTVQKLRDKKTPVNQDFLTSPTGFQRLSNIIDLILNRIIDAENEDVKKRTEKIKNNLSEIKKLITDLIAKQNELTQQQNANNRYTGEGKYDGDYFYGDGDKCKVKISILTKNDSMFYTIVNGDDKKSGSCGIDMSDTDMLISFDNKMIAVINNDGSLTVQNMGNEYSNFVVFKNCGSKFLIFKKK